MRRICSLVVAVAASGAALAEGADAEKELVQEKGRNPWHLTIGPVMAPRVRVRVRGAHPSLQKLSVPNSNRSGTTGATVAADPSAGYVDRTYADGYVKPDEGTDDPDSMIAGLTWDWGADDVAGQHSGSTMQFHTDATRWTETTSGTSYGSGASAADSDRDTLLGIEAMGGWTFLENDTLEVAVDGGFRYYGSRDHEAQSKYGTSVTTVRNTYRYVDSYDASGWTGAIPSGSYSGTPGGPGRLLGATPTRSEELMSSTSSTETHYYNSHTKLDYNIWDLRLGPTVGWKATDCLTLRGGVYGLLGLVDADLKTTVNTANGSYAAKKSRCAALFGMAFGISAQLNLTDNVFLQGGAEYDWWTDSVDLKAGGADARIKLSDFTVSLALGVEF